MDDTLRPYPTVLTELGKFILTDPDGSVHEDGLAMLRETMVKAFVEVSTTHCECLTNYTQYEYLFFSVIQYELTAFHICTLFFLRFLVFDWNREC